MTIALSVGQLIDDKLFQDVLSGSWLVPAIEEEQTQVAHGFSVLDAIYHNWSQRQQAQHDIQDTIATHIVVAVQDADNFTIWQVGSVEITAHWLTAGEYYYGSTTTPWWLQIAEPTTGFSKPLLYAKDANTIILLNWIAEDTLWTIWSSTWTTITASDTLTFDVTLADATSWNIILTVVPWDLEQYKEYTVIKTDATANLVTIQPATGTISWAVTFDLVAQYESITFISDWNNLFSTST